MMLKTEWNLKKRTIRKDKHKRKCPPSCDYCNNTEKNKMIERLKDNEIKEEK